MLLFSDQKNSGIDTAMGSHTRAGLERPRPSKLNSVRADVEIDIYSRLSWLPTAEAIKGTGACRSKAPAS